MFCFEICALYSAGIDVLLLSFHFHDIKDFLLLLLVDCFVGWQSACPPYESSWIQSKHWRKSDVLERLFLNLYIVYLRVLKYLLYKVIAMEELFQRNTPSSTDSRSVGSEQYCCRWKKNSRETHTHAPQVLSTEHSGFTHHKLVSSPFFHRALVFQPSLQLVWVSLEKHTHQTFENRHCWSWETTRFRRSSERSSVLKELIKDF